MCIRDRTRTGQEAWVAQYRLTDPMSMPENSPWPRLLTTRRSACRDASTNTSAGWPSTIRVWMVAAGNSSARGPVIPSTMDRVSAAGSNPEGIGIAAPQLAGHRQALTTSTRDPVSVACPHAHRAAATDASEPSTPTTMVSVPSLPFSSIDELLSAVDAPTDSPTEPRLRRVVAAQTVTGGADGHTYG